MAHPHSNPLIPEPSPRSFRPGIPSGFRQGSRALLLLALLGAAASLMAADPVLPVSARVGSVPDGVRETLNLSPFYQKHVDAGGFPILGSAKVSDYALLEARYIIESMLAGTKGVREGLIQARFRCAIMAADEFTTDIPEHSDLEPKDYWDRRARGLGPTRRRPCISGAEENLLKYPGDPYATENILVHEFAHAIHEALREVRPEFDEQLKKVYASAMEKGLWKGKYAASNRYEYWGECVQSYFGDNRENDSDHNHVNTRPELFEYDPDMARLIDETFQGNPWQYAEPARRQEPMHLAGYDPARAGAFAWPERLRKPARRNREPEARVSLEHAARQIEGWTVQVDIQLLEGLEEELGREAQRVLAHKLREISLLVAEDRLEKLREVTIYLDLEHPELKSMQYHPSLPWLADHGYDTAMARAVHLPRARELAGPFSVNQQPFAVLHELAHAYHDQVLGFEESRLKEAWRKFKEKPDYESVRHISGRMREHYARTDQKEFFAEMTEAYLGVNDFYPFVRGELKEAEPAIYELLGDIWGKPTAD